MKESGAMYGLDANFIYHPPAGDPLNTKITNVYRLESRFSYGKVDYHGGVLENGDGTSTPESFNGINDYMIEIRDLVGKDINFIDQSTI